ncbi:MAG: hypothetical protein ABEJ36_06165 [Candidatus Nanosalina sp.]
MNLSEDFRFWKQGLEDAFRSIYTSRRNLALASTVAFITYVVLVLFTFPEYSYQLLSSNILYIGEAVSALTVNVYRASGGIALFLTVVYAVTAGVAVSHIAAQIRSNEGGLKNILWASPGFIASGCAGCGAGFLGLLGFAGALAALPFHGNSIRVLGIVLMLYYLGDAGAPGTCKV